MCQPLTPHDRRLPRGCARRTFRLASCLGGPGRRVLPMLYRKSSPQPARLLLRIVSTSGAGALLGLAACGGADLTGGAPIPPQPDASDESPVGGGVVGVVAMPEAGADAG